MQNPWLAGSPGRAARLPAQISNLGGGLGWGWLCLAGPAPSASFWWWWAAMGWATPAKGWWPRVCVWVVVSPWSCVSGLRQSRTIGLGKLGGDWLGAHGLVRTVWTGLIWALKVLMLGRVGWAFFWIFGNWRLSLVYVLGRVLRDRENGGLGELGWRSKRVSRGRSHGGFAVADQWPH